MRIRHRQSWSRGARLAGAAALAVVLIGVGGCEDINLPFHHVRSTDNTPVDMSAGAAASGDAECSDLLAQIRESQETRREAPTTSTDPEIVQASQGKADKRIEDLQHRYEALDCPAADAAANTGPGGRQPPLQPAPGGGNR